jgi:hypothetical protein
MYDLWNMIFYFLSYEERFNLRLINHEFYDIYKHHLNIQAHLDPSKHVFYREDPMVVYEFQEMVVEDDRRFVRFKKGRSVVIRSLKFKDGTPYCRDPNMGFYIFKIKRKRCERCDEFTYCKDVKILNYYCGVNCNERNYRCFDHLFHKHKYCVRCRRSFNHLLKFYDDKFEEWWKKNHSFNLF